MSKNSQNTRKPSTDRNRLSARRIPLSRKLALSRGALGGPVDKRQSVALTLITGRT